MSPQLKKSKLLENLLKKSKFEISEIQIQRSADQIIDERAIYNSTKISGAKGSSLEMQGWIWDFEPDPQDKSSESGKIVFEITVDYYGEIVGLKTIS